MQSRWKDLVASVVSGVITSVIVLVAGAWYLNDFAENLRAEPPTCGDPQDLRVLQRHELVVRGDWYGQETQDRSYAPGKVLDGNLGSLWMPRPDSYDDQMQQPFEAAPGAGRLTISFVGQDGDNPVAHDVRLVCVVNGLASEPTRHKNWGRVRTVALDSVGLQEKRTSVLSSLGDDLFQNAQEVAVAPGVTSQLRLSVLSSYTGQTVFTHDGDFCEKDTQSGGGWELAYDPGCLHGPTRRSGLAELYVYVDD